MPYFRLETIRDIKEWRAFKPESRPYNAFTSFWKYCCGASPNSFGVSLPLPLDEYCRPVLGRRTLEDRNDDQVLVRAKLASLGLEKPEDLPSWEKLVAISQLWLW